MLKERLLPLVGVVGLSRRVIACCVPLSPVGIDDASHWDEMGRSILLDMMWWLDDLALSC